MEGLSRVAQRTKKCAISNITELTFTMWSGEQQYKVI